MASKDMEKWRIMNILLLFIHSTTGRRPPTPTNVAMEIQFINGAPNITGKWNASLSIPKMSAIEHYLLVVTVNGTASFNTTVPASTTSVNIFEIFPNISQRRYTTYSLSVASISSTGQSYLTDPVSIVSNLLQSASVTAGAKKIIVSCNIANSVPNALCTAVISNGTDKHVYTFQDGENLITLDYAPGMYNVSIRAHVVDNLVTTHESSIWSISVPSVTFSSSPTMVLSSTLAMASSSFTALSSLPSSTISSLPSAASPLLPTPFAASNGNEDKDEEGDDSKGSSEASIGAVLVTVVVCTLMLSFTIIFTTIMLIWWRHHTKRNDAPNATTSTVNASEKPCIKPTVNIEVDDSPLYEELDTIRDERYSVAVISTKSRINSVLTSNHSSYIEMHPSASINDFGKNVLMQSNPSYHAVTITNS